MIKPEFGKPIDTDTYSKTIGFFEGLLKAMHPFVPFITEELWHEVAYRKEEDCILIAMWPTPKSFDTSILEQGKHAFELITEIRNTRNAKGLSPKESLRLFVNSSDSTLLDPFLGVVKKLSNLDEISFRTDAVSNTTSFMIRATEFYIPMEIKIDAAKERESILKDLEYQRGFMISIDKKLSNEKFVNSAPTQVIDIERKKKADAELKIRALQENLARLLL